PATRERARELQFATGEAGHLNELRDSLGTPTSLDLVDAGVKIEVLPHGEVFVQRKPLRHVADAGFDRFALGGGIEAEDSPAARGRRNDAAQHADRRRLA